MTPHPQTPTPAKWAWLAWVMLGVGLVTSVIVSLGYASAWTSLVVGILLTGLFIGLLQSLLQTRARAQSIARELTQQVGDREALLQESESRFRAMADAAPVLIWASGVDTLCHYFNKVWLEFTGRSAQQEFGNGWAKGIHPDDYQRCLDTYLSAFAARLAFTMEYRLRRFDGEHRWLVDHGVPRHDDQGRFIGYIGSCFDITERKQAEDALRASESFSQDVLNSVQSQIAVIDQAGTIVAVNAVWQQFSRENSQDPGQLTPATGVGTNYLKICGSSGDEAREAVSGIRAVLDGRLPTFSLEYPCHSPLEQRWFAMGVSALRLGHRGAVIVHSDITQRKLAEQRVAASEQRLADIIEGTHVGTWEWRVQTGAVVLNERWAEIVGYTLAELAPVTINTWITLVHPDDRPCSTALLEQHFAGELPFYECQARVRHKAGHWVWVLDRGRVASWAADGKPLLMSGTHQDISAQKALESTLMAAQLQAEAANLAKSRFLATMSHEIRTPMNGVLGMAQLLTQPNLGEAQRRGYARTILSSGQTLLNLLNDILDLSKIEAGKLQFDSAAFAPQMLLDETRDLFAGVAQAKGLRIDCQWRGPHAQRYLSDVHRLRQMLSNLMGNAIKFTARGHVRMEANELERSAEGFALLEFSVQDSGIGIAPEKLDLLFKPFSQTDSSTTREFGGSGLGLSIVRQLALAMGGGVGVSSEVGVGSRFWFRVRAEIFVQGSAGRASERVERDACDAATPASTALPSSDPLRPLDRQTFTALVAELTPLLAQNKFSAINRFYALQTLVAGTALADEVNTLADLVRDLQFEQALVRLRDISSGLGRQASPDSPVSPVRE